MSPRVTAPSLRSGAEVIAIVAHRGLHHNARENSLTAFQNARDLGFDWIEFDVWASSDGLPVICHDETLDRMFDTSGPVADRSAQNLRNVRFRGSLETIPVGLERLSGRLLVEIKPAMADALIARVIESLQPRSEPWMLQSFHPRHLALARSIAPNLPVAWLVETLDQIDQGIANRCPAIHARHDLLTVENVTAMRRAGISVGTWTVNEPKDLRRIIGLRPDMIITDFPERARDLIAFEASRI
jgi:glycerophosphoryl diester phosphodiesterase